MKISVFPGSLVVNSHETARQFLGCVKSLVLIPASPGWVLRVEPGNYISLVADDDIKNGNAAFVPSRYDPDGSITYSWRKEINAWLKR